MSNLLPKSMDCGVAARPLRIALVYSRLPFPMMRGDQTTVAHLISFLAARGHAVDLYDLDLDGELLPAQEAWLRTSCRSVRLYRQRSVVMAANVVVGLARRLPLQISMFANRRMRRDLGAAVAQGEYDVVYCYYPRTARAVPRPSRTGRRGRTRTFLALQLSQTLNTRRMARTERSWLKRSVFRLEAVLMGRFESTIWQLFDRVVLIGPADVAAVQHECRRHGQPEMDNWVYGAHGTDTQRFTAATDQDVVANRVVFSGSMLYPPNIQAVLWFVREVWPLVRASAPQATFVVQGRDPSSRILALDGRDGVVVTGTVPDVGEMIRSAQVCVNPMLAAGGMQNKLIEYMASAKAVVASSIANEGIRAPEDCVVVTDDAAEFAAQVLRFLSSPDEARAMGGRAREHVLENWTWEKHFLDLESAFYDALDEGPGAAGPRSPSALPS